MEKLRSKRNNGKSGKTVLLGVTASIAAYKACELVRLLKKKGYEVKCVMSRDAGWFVTAFTLETLSGHKVAKDMFELPEERDIRHISLSTEADLILVAPATADIIAKVAAGICDDMLSATICASKARVIFAPAMNEAMYTNPIIQDKIEYLKKKGYGFIDPVVGDLACGCTGKGHLAPLEKIVDHVKSLLA